MLIYKNIICFFCFGLITQNVRMVRVQDYRRHRDEIRIFCYLLSLLSREWYKATLKHQSTLVSPHSFTFVNLVYLRLFSNSQPWVVWNKSRLPRVTSNSCSLRSSFWYPFVSAGYGRPQKFSWSNLQSATYMLQVDTPPSSMPPTQFTWHFRWGKPAFCLL